MDDVGLIRAIELQVEKFQNRTGFKCKLILRQEKLYLDQRRSTLVFRIFQQALTNVAFHTNAAEVKTTLRNKDISLILTIRDNGKGITKRHIYNSGSLALVGMRERTIQFGEKFTISGIKGKGTMITVRVPLDKPHERPTEYGN